MDDFHFVSDFFSFFTLYENAIADFSSQDFSELGEKFGNIRNKKLISFFLKGRDDEKLLHGGSVKIKAQSLKLLPFGF